MKKQLNLDAMSIDEMWRLHERIVQVLSHRLTLEKRELEKRLAKLRREKEEQRFKPLDGREAPLRQRRKYPRVMPKYRNPDEPSETWSGRGKRPRWLTTALTTGRTIEEFMIANVESEKDGARRQRA
jgi:DNA-binding protein H-NS